MNFLISLCIDYWRSNLYELIFKRYSFTLDFASSLCAARSQRTRHTMKLRSVCAENTSTSFGLSTADASRCTPSSLNPPSPSTLGASCSVRSNPSTTPTNGGRIPAGSDVIADQPTQILPFLFLGSQKDALSEEVINVSITIKI